MSGYLRFIMRQGENWECRADSSKPIAQQRSRIFSGHLTETRFVLTYALVSLCGLGVLDTGEVRVGDSILCYAFWTWCNISQSCRDFLFRQ